ncbi:hypothetical protein OIU79_014855 [Salix purpurea]|uniref:Uncharacterized protein n=1 Tax=Salix purpurea TaxID=77065 RepID=A0A9Q0PAE0_SALPP|nr:hypothetical protein OIU79_014855 [Salix purpurea]
MCLNEEANFRPLISDILVALEYLDSQSRLSESSTGRVRGTNPSLPYSDRKAISQEPDSRSDSSNLEGKPVTFHTMYMFINTFFIVYRASLAPQERATLPLNTFSILVAVINYKELALDLLLYQKSKDTCKCGFWKHSGISIFFGQNNRIFLK